MQNDFLKTEPSASLSKGFPESLVVLDCETTGRRAEYHRIIEIGLIIIEQGEVTATWKTYINPETALPPIIRDITGIDPAALSAAPRFSDIADSLLETLAGRVLVAHNARFDYGFLRNEFSRAGKQYSTKPLCSLKLSRAMYPQFAKHSLDQIIKRFEFSVSSRHRALDDAHVVHQFLLSTSSLFSESEIAKVCNRLIKTTTLPTLVDQSQIERLPNAPGVYYFYDDKDALLYIGKSIDIRTRVLSHFSQDYKHHKALKMSSRIARIDFTRTPTDFGAQLLESQQIKTLYPVFNSRLRKVKSLLQITLLNNKTGYLVAKLEKVELDDSVAGQAESYGLFRSRRQAMKRLEALADKFGLCHQLLGLEASNGQHTPCFRYQLKRCSGACCQKETAEQYNRRLQTALGDYQKQVWPYCGPVLVEETSLNAGISEPDNSAYHLIDQWVYLAKLRAPEELSHFNLRISGSDERTTTLAGQSLVTANRALETPPNFDLDAYFILIRFLLKPENHAAHRLKVHELESR